MRWRWTDWLIVAFLAFQLAVPLTYYFRDDPYDERFAWRMFSGVRLERCRSTATRVTEAGVERLEPSKLVHAGWVTLIQRNRRVVIEEFLRQQCHNDARNDIHDVGAGDHDDLDHSSSHRAMAATSPATEVRLRNDCVSLEGVERPATEYTLTCASDEVAVRREGKP